MPAELKQLSPEVAAEWDDLSHLSPFGPPPEAIDNDWTPVDYDRAMTRRKWESFDPDRVIAERDRRPAFDRERRDRLTDEQRRRAVEILESKGMLDRDGRYAAACTIEAYRAAIADATNGSMAGAVASVAKPGGRITVVSGADVEVSVPNWLWPGWMERGSLTIIGGDPGVGKGLLSCWLTSSATNAANELPRCDVGFIGIEDSRGILRGRLEAAGADEHGYKFLGADSWDDITFPDFTGDLEEVIRDEKIELLFIDPFENHLDDDIKPTENKSIRKALKPLAKLAEATDCAIVVVLHMNKNEGSNRAMYRLLNSIGYAGGVRSAILFGPKLDDPDDTADRYLVNIKSNHADRSKTKTLRFRVEEQMVKVPGRFIPQPVGRVTLVGPAPDVTQADLLGKGRAPGRPRREEVRDWLRTRQDVDEIDVSGLRHEAADLGFSWRTVTEAKAEVLPNHFYATKDGKRLWILDKLAPFRRRT